MSTNEKYKYLKELWEEYEKKIDEKKLKEIDDCFTSYIDKIKDRKLTLTEYTNRQSSKTNKCGYFCNFLENTSSEIYGSASVGNAEYLGIKMNSDKETYYISKKVNENKIVENASDKKAKHLYEEKLLPFLYDITQKQGLMLKLFNKVENGEVISSKVILRKFVAMNNKGSFLYIYSDDAINAIFDFFMEEDSNESTNIEKNFEVTKKLKTIFKSEEFSQLDESSNKYIIKLSGFLWSIFGSSIKLESKNMILHGAPGTGKTFSIKNTVKNIVLMQGGRLTEQVVFTQFHPSYGYEDFIDGIKPTGVDEKSGQLKLELKNGKFKDLCIEARKKLKEERKANKKDKELTKFFFIADEINRAELSRVFGELLVCLEEDYRIDYDKDGNILSDENLIVTQNSELDNKPVIKIGEKNYFGIPTNLYFIGTMNDIDRSVDSFEMALRRRFYWKQYECQYDVIYENLENKEKSDEYLKICKKLNKYISSSEGLGLGKSYQLGHSYFMKIKKVNNTNLNYLWENHIEPLLKEYMRAEFNENNISIELSKAKKIFTMHKNKK